MKSVIKNIVKKLLEIFDLGIYRISKNSTGAPTHKYHDPFAHIDPLEHNDKNLIDSKISINSVKSEYLTEARLEFYNKVISYCLKNGINFDGKDILDAGCNANCLLEEISNKFSPSSLTGYDYSEKTIQIAKVISPSSKYEVFDLVEDHAKNKFDVIFCTQVIEHIPDAELAIQKLLQLSKPGCQILITVPDGRIDQFRGHIHFWSPESWEIFIRKTMNVKNARFHFSNGELGNSVIISLP